MTHIQAIPGYPTCCAWMDLEASRSADAIRKPCANVDVRPLSIKLLYWCSKKVCSISDLNVIWYLYYIWIFSNIYIMRLTSHPFDEGGFKDTQKISPCVPNLAIYIYNILVLEKTVSKTRHTRLRQNPIRFRKSSSRFFDGDFYWAGIPRWTKPDIKLWVKLRNPYKSHYFYQHFWTKTAKVSQSWGRQTNHWFSLGQT